MSHSGAQSLTLPFWLLVFGVWPDCWVSADFFRAPSLERCRVAPLPPHYVVFAVKNQNDIIFSLISHLNFLALITLVRSDWNDNVFQLNIKSLRFAIIDLLRHPIIHIGRLPTLKQHGMSACRRNRTFLFKLF